MAKIRNAKPKRQTGAYDRLIDNKEIAILCSKGRSTVISNGTELEKIVIENAKKKVEDLDKFIQMCSDGTVEDGTYLCTKNVIKKSELYQLKGNEPDFVIFTVDKRQKLCRVIELKDGDVFDTKKAKGEKKALQNFVNHLAPKIPFCIKFYVCCFNQLDKHKIVTGFKGEFTEDEVMTGKELCDILGIDYDTILRIRKEDSIDNLQYIFEVLSSVKPLRFFILGEQRKHISEDDFYDDDGIVAED